MTVAQRLNVKIILLWGFYFCDSQPRRLLLTVNPDSNSGWTLEHEDKFRSKCKKFSYTSPDSHSCWVSETYTQPWLEARRLYELRAWLKSPLICLNAAVLSSCPNEWLRNKIQTFLLLLQLKRITVNQSFALANLSTWAFI